MKKIVFLLLLFCFIGISSQNRQFTEATTATGIVKIPGVWEKISHSDDSGQTFFKNDKGVIFAVAKNPKKAYPFFDKTKNDFDNVNAFYLWDADYRKENNFLTSKLKENKTDEYIIWRYSDGKKDNIFLYGSSKETFVNLLVYTNVWSQEASVKFLGDTFRFQKK